MPQTPSVVDQFQERNNQLIRSFRAWLIERGETAEAAEAHEFNLDFYLNHYLLHGTIHSAEEGAAPELVQDFLGDFFVHKAMWTDVEEQKSSIQSLLVFYEWMSSIKAVGPDSCAVLHELITREQDSWFAEMEKCSEDTLESWQSSDDSEMADGGFFSEFDFAEDNDPLDMVADIAAFEIPGLEDSADPDDAMLLELDASDEAETDPD